MMTTPPPSKPAESPRPVNELGAAPLIACSYCDEGILFRVAEQFVPTTQAYVRLFCCDRCGSAAVQLL